VKGRKGDPEGKVPSRGGGGEFRNAKEREGVWKSAVVNWETYKNYSVKKRGGSWNFKTLRKGEQGLGGGGKTGFIRRY